MCNIPEHLIGPILWGHSGPLCHALSLSLLSLLWTSVRRRRATVATPGEWQWKIRRRAAARSGEWAQHFVKCFLLKTVRRLISVTHCGILHLHF